jgi:hypothetical protein
LILVALTALWLTLVRSIERMIHIVEAEQWRVEEARCRQELVEARQRQQSKLAAMHEKEVRQCAALRSFHERQLAGFPRTFSRESIVLTVFYLWGVILLLVVGAERQAARLEAQESGSQAQAQSPSWFLTWIGLGFVAPVTIMVLGTVFEAESDLAVNPWAERAVEILLWVQLIHALAGVVVLRGRRWPALGLGIFSVLTTGWISFHAMMAITATWL